MTTILIKKRRQRLPVSITRTRAFLKKVLHQMNTDNFGWKGKEVSIFFTDDENIKELNLAYLGKNRSTNVLSFSQQEGEALYDSKIIGDVVISIDTAQREAAHAALPLDDMIDSLLIHGLLHLAGYDHEKTGRARAKQTRDKEDEIFFALKGYRIRR